MKLLRITHLAATACVLGSSVSVEIESQLRAAIEGIRWPEGAIDFTIYAESGKKRGEGNGVRPMKEAFLRHLVSRGWHVEKAYAEPQPGQPWSGPGRFDAWRPGPDHRGVVVEWETGNISSSHRALNKMALALIEGRLAAGYLVLPSRALYSYLTDRVGNYRELEPYFPLWRHLRIDGGVLAVLEVEHDRTSRSVARIPKGTDGRALS